MLSPSQSPINGLPSSLPNPSGISIRETSFVLSKGSLVSKINFCTFGDVIFLNKPRSSTPSPFQSPTIGLSSALAPANVLVDKTLPTLSFNKVNLPPVPEMNLYKPASSIASLSQLPTIGRWYCVPIVNVITSSADVIGSLFASMNVDVAFFQTPTLSYPSPSQSPIM